ncbi:hypothetical protein B0H16DRAFT_1490613, partial [Mycena metata]
MPTITLSELASKLPAADQEFIARIERLRDPDVAAAHDGPAQLPSQKAISEHFSRIVAGWEPHPFTPQEKQSIRLDALRYLVIVRQIEAVQRDIHPRKLPEEVHAQLLFARQSYMLRYFRIFRVNDLPTEIISNILRFVIWDSMKRPVDARLRVTWTCRRWREIALNDSTLWNAIWFRGSGSRIDRAWAWFERARQAPLDVRIDGDPNNDDQDDVSESLESDASSSAITVDLSEQPAMTAGDMRQMLLRLFTKLASIRMLIIVVDDWKSALVVLELLKAGGPSGVPMLQRFELHRGGKSLAWPSIAPSLAYLSLNGVPIDWSRSVLENLTTFDIRRLPVLTNCPRLQKLSMDGAGPKIEESTGDPIPPFTAPNVNDLTLMNLCGDDYLPLFLQLTSAFPKVRLLTAYSVQFNSSPLGLASMTRWLDSMPLLAYLRVAN